MPQKLQDLKGHGEQLNCSSVRPGAIALGAASAAVETPGIKESLRESKPQYHATSLEYQKRCQERLSVKVQFLS